jgi:hypothetical protein
MQHSGEEAGEGAAVVEANNIQLSSRVVEYIWATALTWA